MLDQMKQAKQMYKLQRELQKETIEVEENGVTITMNGVMEIEVVKLNEELSKEQQERAVKDCFNLAMQKVRTLAAQKMQSLR